MNVCFFYRPHMVEKCQGWGICRNSKISKEEDVCRHLWNLFTLKNEMNDLALQLGMQDYFRIEGRPSHSTISKDQMVALA